jgi:uncharacterized protein (DUF1697 family)
MTDYVALLRGVNVGGITIRSADLRALFLELGLGDARTFLASGNVRFTCDELRDALAAFPFDAADASRQPYLVFCADAAVRDELRGLAMRLDAGIDPVEPGPGVLFWNPVRGDSTSTPFAKQLARARWKAVTTTRNIRTIEKIVA